ncbi:hypothetical protein SAMN05421796_101777 [Chryseobacterium piscicola]|uniref:Uncharacterized protein n=1 Tax=Chryseobacterium piscicola TaxID=551459 RepID=A0A1N7KRU4_9FLAO|nr:hypothetical protein SAMN05421796_101777 [Chryseobacterium piscicola]
MKVILKQIKPKRNKNLPIFLNFILYNPLIKEKETNYCYYSGKYRAIEFYMTNSKLISTDIDFKTITVNNEKQHRK